VVEFIIDGQIAGVAPGVVIPVTGTVTAAVQVGTVTVGTILSPVAVTGTLQANVTIGTVTVGTILNAPLVTVQGTVTAVGGSGGGGYSTVTGTVVVSTVQSPVGANLLGGTVGTILSPVVVATVQSPVAIGGGTVNVQGTVTTVGGSGGGYSTVTGTVVVSTVQSPVGANLLGGTVGTILSPVTVATVQSPVGVNVLGGTVSPPFGATVVGTVQVQGTVSAQGTVVAQIQGQAPVMATVSATINGGGGTIWGIVATNPSAATAGTVLAFAGGFASPLELVVPPTDVRGFTTTRGVPYTGSLVASIIGTLQVTFF